MLILKALHWIFDKHQGAPVFILKSTSASWTLAFLILTTIGAVKGGELTSVPVESKSSFILGSLIFAPLFENMIFIGFVEMITSFKLRHASLIAIVFVALLSGLLHTMDGPWRGIGAAILFATMAYSYLIWSELSFSRRYLLTVTQHAFANAPLCIAMILASDL